MQALGCRVRNGRANQRRSWRAILSGGVNGGRFFCGRLALGPGPRGDGPAGADLPQLDEVRPPPSDRLLDFVFVELAPFGGLLERLAIVLRPDDPDPAALEAGHL